MQWTRIATLVAKNHAVTLALLDDEGIGIGKRFAVDRPAVKSHALAGRLSENKVELARRLISLAQAE
jgi:hypothetical protein